MDESNVNKGTGRKIQNNYVSARDKERMGNK